MNKRRFEELTKQCSNSVLPVTWFGPLDKYVMRGQASGLIKPEPAVLGSWWLYNHSAGKRYVNFYDQPREPERGQSGSDFPITLDPGPNWAGLQIPFYSGLGFTITGEGREPEGDISGIILFA